LVDGTGVDDIDAVEASLARLPWRDDGDLDAGCRKRLREPRRARLDATARIRTD
jgi:hypothetical protein